MSKVIPIAAVRRLAARRAKRSLQAEARNLIEAHGQHVGYAIALATRLVKLSEDERQKLAALSDAIEREVGSAGIFPRRQSAPSLETPTPSRRSRSFQKRPGGGHFRAGPPGFGAGAGGTTRSLRPRPIRRLIQRKLGPEGDKGIQCLYHLLPKSDAKHVSTARKKLGQASFILGGSAASVATDTRLSVRSKDEPLSCAQLLRGSSREGT